MKRPLRIGFLPFYVDYYESLSPDFGPGKRQEIQRCRAMLAAYGEVIGPEGPICDVEMARTAGRELRESGVDCIVALCVIAVFAEISDAALDGLDQPLLLWHCQDIATVDAGYSMVEIVRNTGQIGVQALGNVLARRERPFRALCASRHSTATHDGLAAFFTLTRASLAVRNTRVLQIGEIFPGMADVLIGDDHRRALGIDVRSHDAGALTRAYLEAPQSEVDAELDFMKSAWSMGEITDDELERSARLWVAIRGIAEREKPDCATINSHGMNCLRNPAIGLTATYAISRLQAMGVPCSEVGDIPTVLAMVAARELSGDALYTEVQVLDEGRNAIVLANSGESAESLCRGGEPIRLAGNSNFRGLHGRGASFAYPLAEGPVTVASLSPVGGSGFRLIVMEGEILSEPLPDTGAITGFFRPSHLPLHQAYRAWVEAGAVHHAATASGHLAASFQDLAGLLRWQITTI